MEYWALSKSQIQILQNPKQIPNPNTTKNIMGTDLDFEIWVCFGF